MVKQQERYIRKKKIPCESVVRLSNKEKISPKCATQNFTVKGFGPQISSSAMFKSTCTFRSKIFRHSEKGKITLSRYFRLHDWSFFQSLRAFVSDANKWYISTNIYIYIYIYISVHTTDWTLIVQVEILSYCCPCATLDSAVPQSPRPQTLQVSGPESYSPGTELQRLRIYVEYTTDWLRVWHCGSKTFVPTESDETV